MTAPASTREHIVDVYRKRAKRYDLTARLYYLLGARERAYRRQALTALRLGPGDTMVEIGCGTGRNFPLLQTAVGPGGRIVGVDLTDAMLAQARRRVRARGWSNVSLVQADAAGFSFPPGVNAILSTFALSLLPECAEVIAHGCARRWAVLDLKVPPHAPRWLQRAELAALRPYACTQEWMASHPWDAIRAAMETHLTDFSWTEMYFGCAYLAAGSREPRSRQTKAV